MAVLRALGRLGPGEQPLAAIAASAQLPAPTVHRYLQALLRDGTVEQRGPRAAYALVDALHGAPPFPVCGPTTVGGPAVSCSEGGDRHTTVANWTDCIRLSTAPDRNTGEDRCGTGLRSACRGGALGVRSRPARP
ncbi:helix-turn-helix domain-containing protein [Streptomyces xanthochromogenes]